MICYSGDNIPKWTKNGKKLRRGHIIQGTSLKLPNIKHTDSGVYTCHGLDFIARSLVHVGGM